ncbi:MAG: NAD(P)H-quinone oxidoreductase [Actinomycetes bacterium]
MQAIVIVKPGDPEVLTWTQVPDPVPAAGEVLIKVAASAVNRADLLQRQGFYPPPAGAPPYPGLECSGTIIALGASVTDWSIGDQCCALLSGGGYAEQVAIPANQVMPIPAGVDLISAAGLPEVACTVWSNIVLSARLHDGETLLIHGGASGIGTFAIQAAKALGARVAVTAGSERKLDACRELGADITINYRDADFVAAVRAATDGQGADVILDNMGGSYLARNVEALALGGRLVVIGMQGGVRAELDLGQLMASRASVTATSLRARPNSEKAAICAAVVADVWPLIAAGQIKPIVDRVLPMPQAAEAHRLVAASEHIGKVLLAT